MSLIYQVKINATSRAPQHLSDCLRKPDRPGQFVSASREASRIIAWA
jgi:hypothetical protein